MRPNSARVAFRRVSRSSIPLPTSITTAAFAQIFLYEFQVAVQIIAHVLQLREELLCFGHHRRVLAPEHRYQFTLSGDQLLIAPNVQLNPLEIQS